MIWIEIAPWLVRALGAYAALGTAFAVPFLARGIELLDPGARGSSWGFRLTVFPGVVVFWPLLLRRWLAGATLPIEGNAHRRAAHSGDGEAR